jgi:hypothetical protein
MKLGCHKFRNEISESKNGEKFVEWIETKRSPSLSPIHETD